MVRRGKRSSRVPVSSDGEVPEIYHQLLADAISSTPADSHQEPKVKKRRIQGHLVLQNEVDAQSHSEEGIRSGKSIEEKSDLEEQIAYNDDDSEDSELVWEDIALRDQPVDISRMESPPKDLELVLGRSDVTPGRPSRLHVLTGAERKMRMQLHKMHILCLIVHIYGRNHWCNDHRLHKILRHLVPKKLMALLRDDDSLSQFQRSRSLMEGLSQISELFRSRFRITARGLSRPRWIQDIHQVADVRASHMSQTPDDLDLIVKKDDFIDLGKSLEASRDVGAQLFCALLRATGLDVRLVCSLQPLPFSSSPPAPTPSKPSPAQIIPFKDSRMGLGEGNEDGQSDVFKAYDKATASTPVAGRIKSRMTMTIGRGMPSPEDIQPDPPLQEPKKRSIRESPHPVFWVEVFNPAVQKWIPIDLLVTKTIAQAPKLEPPANDLENQMSYVVAFEDDGTAKDVTRRYAKAFNAKTRRLRVEVSQDGSKWWRRVLKMYESPYPQDRDQIEDTELNAREAAEGMPSNIQDFKNHPHYALERHLRRTEIIHPKIEVGKIATGKALSDGRKTLEPVFRHRDVRAVKSAEGWYRVGRELRPGEQPLKYVPRRRRIALRSSSSASEDDSDATTPMYAPFQTTLYRPPPVVNGRIPTNAFGNWDVYMPNMVPLGAAHILHSDAKRAARLLGVQAVDAVVGFEWKARRGAAVLAGVLVLAEHEEAVRDLVQELQLERDTVKNDGRVRGLLGLWKKFHIGLTIRERINGYEVEGERAEQWKTTSEMKVQEVEGSKDDQVIPAAMLESNSQAGRVRYDIHSRTQEKANSSPMATAVDVSKVQDASQRRHHHDSEEEWEERRLNRYELDRKEREEQDAEAESQEKPMEKAQERLARRRPKTSPPAISAKGERTTTEDAKGKEQAPKNHSPILEARKTRNVSSAPRTSTSTSTTTAALSGQAQTIARIRSDLQPIPKSAPSLPSPKQPLLNPGSTRGLTKAELSKSRLRNVFHESAPLVPTTAHNNTTIESTILAVPDAPKSTAPPERTDGPESASPGTTPQSRDEGIDMEQQNVVDHGLAHGIVHGVVHRVVDGLVGSEAAAAWEVMEGVEETGMQLQEDSDLDRGSLISHDPDDDDAEPDWLV